MPRKTYVTEARHIWPRAEWIIGAGQYASVAYCGVTTVMLFRSLAEAERAKAAFIDRLACGHVCRVEHEIVNLETP